MGEILLSLIVVIGISLYTFLVGVLCFKWGRYTKEREIEMDGASFEKEFEKTKLEILLDRTGCCPCCQSTDLLITAKKVICKSCNNWSWLEDAVNSSWIKEIKNE